MNISAVIVSFDTVLRDTVDLRILVEIDNLTNRKFCQYKCKIC